MIDKLDKTFNVSKFYQSRLQKTNQLLSSDVEKMDKDAAFKALQTAMFAKDTLAYYPTEGRLPSEFYVGETSDWMARNKKPIKYFGYKYRTVAYDESKDTLAILNKVAFPALNMAENNKGEFAYLSATKASRNKKDFLNLMDYLKKNTTVVKLEENPSEGITFRENKNFYYLLSKKDGKEEDIISFDASGNKNSKIVDVSDLRLEIYSKDYIQNLRKEKAYIPEYIRDAK